MYYKNIGSYDFSFRPYGVQLPANYDPTKAYPVVYGGGGCGGDAQNFAGNPNGGFDMAPKSASVIRIGLAYVSTCFSDGGPDVGNRPDNPDEPYFRAVEAEVEANYCVDLSRVFVGGFSSGGWESYMLGCAASDIVRGMGADEGGQRAMHPTCKNPVAAVLVAGEADTENPIGPLTLNTGAGQRLGSYGSGPSKDEILMRNGCTGTATAPADPMYPACVKYTGCPAAYPVIWCSLPGVGHNNSTYMSTNYSPGMMWSVLSALPAPQ
jgi:poly(3-hydroxybutyrate) depolymerase